MTFITVQCPICLSEQIVTRGQTRRGTPRYLCQHIACTQGSFLLDFRHHGCLPAGKHQSIDRSLNASGMRDTARVLRISTDTVRRELRKKDAALKPVNSALLRALNPEEVLVDIARAGEAEMDECGVLSGSRKTRGGCGMRWLTPRVRSEPLSSVVVRMKAFCSGTRCWSLVVSHAFILIIGGRTSGIWRRTCLAQANGIPRRLRGSI